jgi:hypothetical protein
MNSRIYPIYDYRRVELEKIERKWPIFKKGDSVILPNGVFAKFTSVDDWCNVTVNGWRGTFHETDLKSA